MSKLQRSIEVIKTSLAQSKNACVAWSGGKDSMVLLHIARSIGINLPVIFFREPWQPWKYKFQDKIIQDWGLVSYTWHPSASSFQQSEDEFEVQNTYRFGNTNVTCPSGITTPVDGKPWVCAIDMANRPKQDRLLAGWDMAFVGHKGCDSDPIYGGDAGTRVEVRSVPGQATMVFPLRDWTHDDIWEYIESNGVPWDEDRYEKVDGKFREKQDKLLNVDYVHACTACIDRRSTAPKFVTCPKFNAVVENCSHYLVWHDQSVPSYMKD